MYLVNKIFILCICNIKDKMMFYLTPRLYRKWNQPYISFCDHGCPILCSAKRKTDSSFSLKIHYNLMKKVMCDKDNDKGPSLTSNKVWFLL